MKIIKNIIIVFGIIILTVSILFIVSTVAESFIEDKNDKTSSKTECKKLGENIKLVINNDEFNQKNIIQKKCDTLTITNKDDKIRHMAFGEHDKHKSYDGIREKQLTKGETFTVTLNETGSFILHDHDDEQVEVKFTVQN